MILWALVKHFLRGKSKLNIPNYNWYGQTRKWIRKTAKRGSGCIGFLIRERVLQKFVVVDLDNDVEGILWLTFTVKHVPIVFTACVCYLPPQYSVRSTDATEIYHSLLGKLYLYQNMGPLHICGDFNSRIWDMADYIEGIDSISERHVVDFDINSYGDNLIEFLTDSSCCVVNGINSICDDFTHIGSTGRSVSDYCITPHEHLGMFSEFSVIRMTNGWNWFESEETSRS